MNAILISRNKVIIYKPEQKLIWAYGLGALSPIQIISKYRSYNPKHYKLSAMPHNTFQIFLSTNTHCKEKSSFNKCQIFRLLGVHQNTLAIDYSLTPNKKTNTVGLSQPLGHPFKCTVF